MICCQTFFFFACFSQVEFFFSIAYLGIHTCISDALKGKIVRSSFPCMCGISKQATQAAKAKRGDGGLQFVLQVDENKAKKSVYIPPTLFFFFPKGATVSSRTALCKAGQFKTVLGFLKILFLLQLRIFFVTVN